MKKYFIRLEKTHSMTLNKLEKLKKSLDEFKVDNTKIECKFSKRLDNLTCANENLNNELVDYRKSISTHK